MKVEYLSPGDLYPYPQNAKIHTPDQVKRISASIKAFGFQQPIVVDKDNVVIIGHGRLFAAQELHLDSVPVVRADDLTEDQVKALRLADNKLNESPYDFSKLEEELAALDIAGFDMEQFGFTDPEQFYPEESPDGFKEYGEGTETKHKCPRCGYEWN
jgi:ParB-like chromosome segregation protein Spo0J